MAAMRPQTPTLLTAQAGPTSPPETPTTGSPTFSRRLGPNGGKSSRNSKVMHQSFRRASITPLGGVGAQFTYPRGPRPEEISPRSSSSSDEDGDEDDEEEDDDEEDENNDSDSSAGPPQSPIPDIPEIRHHITRITTALHIITEANFSIEELSDKEDDNMDSEYDALNVLRPSGYEYPESDHSRSRSRQPKEVDPEVMRDFQGLNCFDSSDDSEWDLSNDEESEAMAAAIRQKRNERRHRRMTSGSISKRTVSDRGSDSDREDLQPWDHGEAGPNPRRIRRKTDRFSWLSSATTHDIIYELNEPTSDVEESIENGNLARELPYYLYMAVDSD